MKNHSQILIIALAVSFAMALALAVSLICLSYIEDEPSSPVVEQTGGAGESLTDMSPTETAEPSQPPMPILPSGLRFTSNGDGTCVLSGIGDCTDPCVVIPEFAPSGERVTAVSAMAFYGCATVQAVQIPASVQSVGSLAFSACSNLAYISVSAENPCYRDVDGVLYTADLVTLILYPPMRAGTQMTVSVSTKTICDMAFYGCAYLERVVYTGSAEEWELIRIGSKNYSLTASSVTFEAR